jgi:hypothetical protein
MMHPNPPLDLVSYLFRSLGSIIGISMGSTLVEDTLRKTLHLRLSGTCHEVEKVRIGLMN